MGNIRLFFSNSITIGMTDMLDKSQSHYLNKVMRVKENELFSLFNNRGEWEAKILKIFPIRLLSYLYIFQQQNSHQTMSRKHQKLLL